MGCSAALNSISSPVSFFLFSSLYLWQIPHFMAISYKCQSDYRHAGYSMLPIHNPGAAATQAVLHSVLMLPLCVYASSNGMLPFWFSLISLPINYYLQLRPAIAFKRDINYKNATSLFWCSLAHLPILFGSIVLASWVARKESVTFEKVHQVLRSVFV